jgi:lipopolysaccharide transport system ATP-binding protein
MLVDEVLAVGDAGFQNKCKLKIRDIALSGRTILFTSHDMEAVARICGSAIVLDRGRVVYQGAVDGAIGRYQTIMQAPRTPAAA